MQQQAFLLFQKHTIQNTLYIPMHIYLQTHIQILLHNYTYGCCRLQIDQTQIFLKLLLYTKVSAMSMDS